MAGTFHYMFIQACGLYSTSGQPPTGPGLGVIGRCWYRLTTCNRHSTLVRDANQKEDSVNQRDSTVKHPQGCTVSYDQHPPHKGCVLLNSASNYAALPCHVADTALSALWSQSP